MTRIAPAVRVLSAVVLGLSAGAILAEGVLLVPWWRALPPQAFLAWYAENAERLVAFFGPLEGAAGVLALAAAVLPAGRRAPLVVAAVLAVAILVMFPLYFQGVNASFAAGTIPVDGVGAELARWARWHWCRTVLAIVAAVAAVAGVRRA
ncbi:MAG TPA: hypothetical protein VKA21_02055 [Candidatus Binatia bacterium]|nr:hypothetical protein [Candidatus Binatia bacterium]